MSPHPHNVFILYYDKMSAPLSNNHLVLMISICSQHGGKGVHKVPTLCNREAFCLAE